MFNLYELQTERAEKAITAKGLIERVEKLGRPMSAEDCAFFDGLEADIKKLDTQISDIQAHQRRKEASAKIITDLEGSRRTTEADPPANPNASTTLVPFRVPATARRTGTLKAFKGQDGDHRAYRAGMWIRAYLFNDRTAHQYCMNHGLAMDPRNAMSTGSNPDGGFLVPDELSQSIIDLREEYGVYRREVRVWPMGSDTLKIPRRAGGVTIGPIGENPTTAISQSNPTFGMIELVARKAGGLCLLSSEMAQDALIDLADWVASEFAFGFALFEDTIGFTGNGSAAHLGVTGLTNLLTEASGLAGAVLAIATHDTFAEVDQTDIAKVMAAIPQFAATNAKFYCSRVCSELVFGRLMAIAGGNTVQSLEGSRGPSYLGYPIVVSQVLPSSTGTIADGTPMLFFGDLRKSSSMGDRRQVRIFASEHRYMDTDQIGIRGDERIDIANHDIGTTALAGPMVALLSNTA